MEIRGPNAYCKAHIKRASRLIRTFYDCTCKTNFLGERFVKDFEKRRKKMFEKGATLNTLGPHICKTTFYHYSRVFLMLKQTSKTVKQIIKTKSAFNGTLYLKCLKPCRNIVFWIKKSQDSICKLFLFFHSSFRNCENLYNRDQKITLIVIKIR